MKKCWLISVNMGYGHQRTAYPLKDIAFKGEIINANDYRGIPKGDRQIWETTRNIYEFISRFSRIPLVGSAVFSFYDQFQKILKFYPRRDLSKPTSTLKEIYAGIKRGWGRHLIEKIIKNAKKGRGRELNSLQSHFVEMSCRNKARTQSHKQSQIGLGFC